MANLSCIHISWEVFQNPVEHLWWKVFEKIADDFFLQKSSIVDARLGSKYAFGVVLLYSICVIRILAWPLKFSSEGMLFLVNIWAEEQQLYKTELVYVYLLNIYQNFYYLLLIYCQNPKWSWKNIYFGRAHYDGCFQHLSFKVLKQKCSQLFSDFWHVVTNILDLHMVYINIR